MVGTEKTRRYYYAVRGELLPAFPGFLPEESICTPFKKGKYKDYRHESNTSDADSRANLFYQLFYRIHLQKSVFAQNRYCISIAQKRDPMQ